MGEERNVYRILVGRPKETRPLEGLRHRWDDNIKVDLREMGISGANRIQLDQDRVHWWAFCEYGNEPLGSTQEMLMQFGQDVLPFLFHKET
jgi:hypothetical protein